MRTIKLFAAFIAPMFFSACFIMKVGAVDPVRIYEQQVAMNPEQICTPQMLQEVWTGIYDEYFKPITNKELFKSALSGLEKAIGQPIKLPERSLDEDYTAYDYWLFLWERKTASKKSLSDLCYASIQGMVQGLNNPYSEFIDAKNGRERFFRSMGQIYYGLGFLFVIDYQEKRVYVDDVFPGSPAERGGLKRFDEILALDGKTVKEMDLLKIQIAFRGKRGTVAKMLISRNGFKQNATFMRGAFNNYKDAYCKMMQGVPYCRLYGFGAKTYENFEKSFQALPRHGKKIIFDLRNNPGGMVFTATQMLGKMWLKNRTSVVFIKRKFGVQPFSDNYNTALLDGYKAVLLINHGTVSSAEFFAGAVKDYKKAVLIGNKTYGKGVAQKTTYPYGATLSVVFAYVLTPFGNVIDKKGIEPDINIELTIKDRQEGRDPPLEKALKYLGK
jgi:carboxyl-terminal processing protease